jgi:hypothetical protein
MQNKNRLSQSQIYLFYLAAFTFINVLLESNIDQESNVITILHVFRLIVMAGLAIVIFNSKISKKNFIFLSLMSLFALVNIVVKDGSIDVLTLLLIIFASKKAKLSSVFKTSIVSISVAYLFVIVLSQIGVIESVNVTRYLNLWIWKGGYTRTSLGFQFPNQVPLALFYIATLSLIYFQSNFTVSIAVILLIVNFIVYSQCNARTPFVLTIIVTVIGLMLAGNKVDDKKKRIIAKISIGVIIITLLLSYILPLLYASSSVVKTIDLILNHRISSGYLAIQKNGISLFGSGREAGTVANGIKNIYTVEYTLNVDNGFVIFLLQYGLVITLLYFYLGARLIRIAKNRNNIYIIIAIVLIVIANISDANLVSTRVWPIFTICFNYNDALVWGQANNRMMKLKLKKRRTSLRVS